MLGNLFNPGSKINFQDFIIELKKGNRDFFTILQSPENSFEEASFEELLSNQADVLSGVNRVQKKFRTAYFGLFNGCLVKHHDNGNIKFVFFTTTNDTKTIIQFSQVLFHEFGHGIYKENEFKPFTDREKIILLSKGVYNDDKDNIAHLWLYEDLSILLQYTTSPLRQFSLMITKNAEREYDKTIRRNGTILNLLNLDVNDILSQKETRQTKEFDGDKIKFIDYTFILAKRQMNVFDKIIIRIFDSKRDYNESTYTHLTFSSSKPINADDKIKMAEKIIKIYGQDNGGTGEIEFHERDLIEQNVFWTGRRWSFNQSHGLWNMNNKDEKPSYIVAIDSIDDVEGFNVSILGYNELVSLFGEEK